MTVVLLTVRYWLRLLGSCLFAVVSSNVLSVAAYYLLEDGFTLLLVNMKHLKQAPGRNTHV